MIWRIIVYIIAVVFANLLVHWLGAWGLLASSFFLIPFDFVMRAYFQEQWRGRKLYFNLGGLILSASVATYLINYQTQNIAIASAVGFIVANIAATFVYQKLIASKYLLKINTSDFVAIVVDSVVFQLIAFGIFDWRVALGQTVIKFLGGLLWYYILFHKKDNE